ncbi:unnamed protein product [Acanthoscelides obtectus]|uniref:Uncharacterized protein n=1 Tax=Acanthoscelides obtectus TaxID=200917 RepID=A0A9P0KSV1_ACAOB|nr:unnamed protein product [Acanthoscelides obtectus]CAK1641904.1 hypothetical protein AOBTE_LOCUS12711 [Acanthoscelides obtectus]
MSHNENDSTIQPSINDMIWTKKKPSEMDNEATHLMLSLREEKILTLMTKEPENLNCGMT